MNRYKGVFKITFSSVLAKHGWDLAYDLDGYMKTIDRPNVPRLLPHIRLNKEGHPATAQDDTGRKKEKTLASLYVPEMNRVVKAVYDPSYEDPDYRYRLMVYEFGVNATSDTNILESDTYGGLYYLLLAFCEYWVNNDHLDCTEYLEVHVAARPVKEVSEAYRDKGYGLFG
ncbi:hypothetical protein CNR34_00135 [Pseudomonas phage nickie]|uniref:Uncharacterized protein n=1 Tax=Pseudomonas phage nickie TaxID=2048977 RepID=A0A2H4P7C0_9CAUD|nr:hypothetical protein FDJ16_gp030 [Pseudomonas phage nickie]ATW58068.1 hypothetical protein CNR34_00135 [Pseudomonas phage nickie]